MGLHKQSFTYEKKKVAGGSYCKHNVQTRAYNVVIVDLPRFWAEYLSLQSISSRCLASLHASSWSYRATQWRSNSYGKNVVFIQYLKEYIPGISSKYDDKYEYVDFFLRCLGNEIQRRHFDHYHYMIRYNTTTALAANFKRNFNQMQLK